MNLTNDQYFGLSKMSKWYRKYQQQFIEISGVVGTGTWDLIQQFIEHTNLDQEEIMYLSYNQKQVLELAWKKLHAYYINGIIYNYIRIVDFDTLPILNPQSKEIGCHWEKEVRKKPNGSYKLIIVFDSMLLNHQTINDLATFGLPVILVRDPMLLPAPDTYTFLRDANINLHEPHPEYLKQPIIYFAHKILNREPMKLGNYDTVSVVPKKQINLYNLRSSDMNITISEELKNEVNMLYRSKILKQKDIVNVPNEKVIVTEALYGQKLTNPDNKKVKVYFTKGTVGYIIRMNKHAVGTKYVPIEFRPEFYHSAFTGMSMDRHHLNRINIPSQQIIPDEIAKFDYAYAITAASSRLSHWDKVTLIVDNNDEHDPDLQQRLLYTAIVAAKKSLTIIL